MIDDTSLPMLNELVDLLTRELVSLQEQLRRAENRAKGWNPRTCNRLRERIDRVKVKLERAERLQELALSRKPKDQL